MRQVVLGYPAMGLALAVLLAAIALAAALAVRQRVLRRQLGAALAKRDALAAGSAAAERMLRLAVAEFRGLALTLLGHADQLRRAGAEPARHGSAIAAIVEQMLSLVDAFHEHALPSAVPRALHKEPLCLGEVLADVIAAVNAAVEPARRNWRIAPDLDARHLLADRRALNQILLRVLTNAALLSRHDDWIDISCAASDAGLTLIVADEGNGLVGRDPPWMANQPDSRGLGLGLSLARVLMDAHGGALSVESTARVGTRVTLSFPAAHAAPAARLAA